MLIKLFITFVLLIILLIDENVCTSHKKRDILLNQFKSKTQTLKDINVWKNKLKSDFKANLQQMPENIKKDIIQRADKELTIKWEPLLAMDYLEYKIDGNRANFEGKGGKRRIRLMNLVLGELLTEKGKYMNEIANGLWLILEESTWVLPAHLSLQKAGIGLPDPKQFVVDLGVGETSAYLAWLKFLLGDQLAKISKTFNERIDFELNRRLVNAFLKSDYWWTGLKGQPSNNWNVWINSNILITSLIDLNDASQRMHVINRSVVSVDDWVNWYGEDGGCDEGPEYWSVAGGRFIQFVYYMSSVSNHQMEWSSNKLIKNIGSYIYKMHIEKDYFVNFADSKARTTPEPNVVFLFGQALNDQNMKDFASYLYQVGGKDWRLGHFSQQGSLHQFYLQMSAYNLLRNMTGKAPQPKESWLPDLQIITMRTTEGSAKGLFFAAKAGTNDENHNHNDIGNFVIFIDGMPALIDIGVGTYNSKTFSKQRYDIWTMQSQWHSTPTINEVQQRNGPTYKAKNVGYKSLPNGGEFQADIAGAYPKEAHVKTWIRKLSFDRTTNNIDLTETYILDKFIKPFKLHFITITTPSYEPNSGQIVFKNKNITLLMNFDSKLFDVTVDEHKTEDSRLSSVWGERVNRVTLVSKLKELKGEHTISFHL